MKIGDVIRNKKYPDVVSRVTKPYALGVWYCAPIDGLSHGMGLAYAFDWEVIPPPIPELKRGMVVQFGGDLLQVISNPEAWDATFAAITKIYAPGQLIWEKSE
jgi:hypothetical protein